MLRWWEQHHLVRPLLTPGRAPTVYRTTDLVAAQALAVLRRDGAPLQRIRRALRALEGGVPEIIEQPGEWRLAVLTSGDVCRLEDAGRLLELTRRPGQLAVFLNAGELVAAAHTAVEQKRAAS